MTAQQELTGQLGRYTILRKLGAGGMGAVYLAEDTRLPRKVALKVPHLSAADGQALKRFRREAALAAGIEHPNLCPVLDIEETNGIVFFTMPFIEGAPLSRLIEKGKPWPVSEAIELVRKIGEAVAHLHAHGIIHRDLKPGNIMVRPSGEPMVMDFGLARDVTSEGSRLTRTGTALGSPAFMAPEQVAGEKDMGPAVDVYGLGVILFQLLTGRLPFEAAGPPVFAQILQDAPPPLSSFRPGLNPRLEALCLKALRKNPGERPPGIESFLQELARLMAEGAASTLGEGKEPEKPFPLTAPPTQNVLQRPDTEPLPPDTTNLVADSGRREQRLPGRPFGKWLIGMLLLVSIALACTWVFINGRTTPKPKGAENSTGMKAVSPGEVVDVEIGNGVRMKFCWIPPGEAQLGSTKAERMEVLKQLNEEKEPDWLQSEAEEVRGKYTSKGLWLGKYNVTQEQWQTLMGNNPSWFVPTQEKIKEAGIKDTSRFPVEQVSWHDCQDFLKEMNKKVKVPAALGEGKFVLPHEDEWEYACRGGKGNKGAFYFGDELNGKQANCLGNNPFGTTVRGPYLERTTAVDGEEQQRYEKEAPHPLGLCDMAGNVSDWCENVCGKDARVLRGGSWYDISRNCRSAYRNIIEPGNRYQFCGARICFRLK